MSHSQRRACALAGSDPHVFRRLHTLPWQEGMALNGGGDPGRCLAPANPERQCSQQERQVEWRLITQQKPMQDGFMESVISRFDLRQKSRSMS